MVDGAVWWVKGKKRMFDCTVFLSRKLQVLCAQEAREQRRAEGGTGVTSTLNQSFMHQLDHH